LVARSEAVSSSLIEIGRPAKSLWICRIWRQRSSASMADIRLVVVIAPALTIGEFGLSL
jgi:hypothetical protein